MVYVFSVAIFQIKVSHFCNDAWKEDLQQKKDQPKYVGHLFK